MKYPLIIVSILFFFGCGYEKTEVNNKIEKQYDYRAAFLVVDGVYESELTAPFDILHHTIFHAEKGI